MRRQLIHQILGQQLLLSGPKGQSPRSLLDFGALGFDPAVADALIRGFIALQGHNVIESQRQVWREIRCLASALSHKVSWRPLPATCIPDLNRWLEQSHYGPSARQRCMNSVCRLLRWCARNIKGVVAHTARLIPSQFLRLGAPPKQALDEATIKAILRCCYGDIEKTEARLARATMLREGSLQDAGDDGLQKTILELLKIGHGDIPLQREVYSASGGSRVMAHTKALGGLTRVAGYLYPSIDDVFPYYLAILIQTSANPQALRLLQRSCIEPHAVRSDLERMVWEKPRARKEQSVDFPTGRAWSAPNLVRRLCALNSHLLASARQEEKHLVFVARGARGERGVLSWQTMHNCLATFRKRHELVNFQFRDLRRAGAKLHHTVGQSIRAAKLRLNHDSEITTQRYTPASDRQESHELAILKFQGMLIYESLSQHRVSGLPDGRKLSPEPAETVFGFSCADPFAGVAPGSEAGKMCLQFLRCATCPGALIAVDDVRIVAKLLSASQALLQAQQRSTREGWTTRFELVYGPVKMIIDQDILPLVSNAVVAKAQGLVDMKRLPWIE
ncbi:hypothetical protein ACXIVK_32605 [Paraburkholderia caledonica]